jgi:hypothetical protein
MSSKTLDDQEPYKDDPYFPLERILDMAYDQASEGKGKARHAKKDEPFKKQKICEITRRVGLGYPLGQAIKKAEEAQRLPYPANVQEILGAINYLAAAVIIMEEDEE